MVLWVASCGTQERGEPVQWEAATADTRLHPVDIAQPPGVGKLVTTNEETGEVVAIGCPTCHSEGQRPAMASSRPEDAAPFHTHVQLKHGALECSSCHSANPSFLHLSNAELLPISSSMTLCSQCHGPIRRAYDNGAHGGMRGYWDLQRGPRTRNDCITCHSPHAPSYPQVTPAEGPIDRIKGVVVQPGSYISERFKKEGS